MFVATGGASCTGALHLKLSLNLFKPVLNKPSLSRLSFAKPSLNQISALLHIV